MDERITIRLPAAWRQKLAKIAPPNRRSQGGGEAEAARFFIGKGLAEQGLIEAPPPPLEGVQQR